MDETAQRVPKGAHNGDSIDSNGVKRWIAPVMDPVDPARVDRNGVVSPAQPIDPDLIQGTRADIVRKAVADWTRRLVNLDGRNRMLYFRELRRGTLEISPDHEGVRPEGVDLLISSGTAALAAIFKPAVMADAALRILALAAKARSNFEEKGIATLYLGYSFASWTRADGHTPRAPVVMIPIRIVLEGPGGHDATIEVRGPAEVNPSFVHAMRADLGRDPYPDSDERSEDFREWLPAIEAACAEVADFELDGRLFLANLEFSKLPMVLDMEQHLPLLINNDLVAAIAGDTPARNKVRIDHLINPDLPDHTPPAEEFLVCDADASQSQAIAAVLRGQNLVVHGPPGTGKSQTIANLISSLAAEGKSVLFVAEKRAAIGAVTRRLDAAGCGELVLDLHDGTRRRQVVKSLETSIDSLESLAGHDEVLPHANLAAARKRLVAHRRQMHQPRLPHGLSFFALQAMVGTPDHEVTGVRISSDVLDKWTEEGRENVQKLVEQWQVLAERLDEDLTGVWAGSLIRNAGDADQVRSGIERLMAAFIPTVESAYRSSLAELQLPADSEVPVREFSEFLSTLNDLFSRYQPEFLDRAEAIAADLAPAQRSAVGRIFARLTSRRYRKAMRELTSLNLGTVDARAVLADAQRIAGAQRLWTQRFPGRPMPRQAMSGPALATALGEYTWARDRLVKKVPSLAGGDFYDEEQALRTLSERLDLADCKAELSQLEASIGEYGLGPLLRDSTKKSRQEHDLSDVAIRVFAASAIDAITWREPELAMFSGEAQEQVAIDFAKLDRRHMEATPPRVMKKVAERAILALDKRPREAALLRHEVEAGPHHMPVRQLLSSVTNVAKALRPCWAMSPLLVSRMLPATSDLFDVVIFDEGSQILPIHAIPAIARAGQAMVAGDPRQLPPSEFLASDSLEDQADREGRDMWKKLTADAESILDVMRELVLERKLLWHYRSQDERLINFSNTHIYDRSLVTFPGTKRGTGIRHVLAAHTPASSTGTSSNPEVVRNVVELILDHARNRSDESLGVIAMGLRHANDISRALRVARLEMDEDFGGFFEEKGAEPFFVKIMTSAQGDERDHIILSVGYGKNPSGDMVYRWGSLSRRGGHRRLNVAVTRAKRRMTVVSAVTADEIDPAKTRTRGAALLKEYLEYAEAGGESIQGPDTAPLTAFEISVRDRLTEAGIPVEPHYGGGRHRIDFAAFDDKRSRRPVMAIETDGLGYNSSDTARDRDRLRLEVLRKRGWRHHRIWSTDWYRDPEREIVRAQDAWENAVATMKSPSLQRGSDNADRPIVAGRGRSPIAIRRSGILGYERDELVQLIQWIKSDGLKRNDDQLIAAAVDVLGLEDVNNHRVVRALRGAIAEANQPG